MLPAHGSLGMNVKFERFSSFSQSKFTPKVAVEMVKGVSHTNLPIFQSVYGFIGQSFLRNSVSIDSDILKDEFMSISAKCHTHLQSSYVFECIRKVFSDGVTG